MSSSPAASGCGRGVGAARDEHVAVSASRLRCFDRRVDLQSVTNVNVV